MRHDHPESPQTLGADLRALRKARGFTLTDMAKGLGRSVGWMSQVERDKSEPSITDLRHIAAHLGVSSVLGGVSRGTAGVSDTRRGQVERYSPQLRSGAAVLAATRRLSIPMQPWTALFPELWR